jgi:hypothetical protein
MNAPFPFSSRSEAMGQDRSAVPTSGSLEAQIDVWRSHLRGRRAISGPDAAELEDHLRELVASLRGQGLSDDEAFLVAVKRLGAIDALTREFAREHSDRLWKQLVLSGAGPGAGAAAAGTTERLPSVWVALGLALAAAVAIKIPELFGKHISGDAEFYVLNFAFFTLPFIAAYFAWERPLSGSVRLWLAGAFALAALVVNLFPFSPSPGSHTQVLTALHLPIALWLAVGVAYVGGRWLGSDQRLDFIRFTGELFVYYVLIALGGAVLIGLTYVLFEAIGLEVQDVIEEWILPCGMVGATVIGTWLVEAKQSVIENIAPVLTRVFTPLFAALLLAFLLAILATGRAIDPEREILIGFDLLLVVVFGLLLYSISARDPMAPPGLMDWIQLTLVVTALVVDVLALWAIGSRIFELGYTPNRVTALGENVVLLANLGGSALLYAQFLRGRAAFSRLWEWQTGYLYVLAGWAAVVALLFPPLFGFN